VNYLIRFGFIGDIITAVEASKLLNARLLVSDSKQSFFFNRIEANYVNTIRSISKQTSSKISLCTIEKIQKIVSKDNNARFFMMTQSLNFRDKIFVTLLRFFTKADIEILNEGTQTFYGSILRNNEQFLNHLKNIRNDSLNISIVWDGKEYQKNLNITQIERILNILQNKFDISSVNIIGKNKFDHNIPSVNNLSGKTSLEEALLIIDKSDLVVSVDTGLLHYAAYKRKPIIAIVPHRLRLANWFPSSGPTALISNIDSKNKYISVKSKKGCELNKEINDVSVSKNLEDLLKSV
tara:strand:+ start:98 stop:979 length:882 start_codon:yes stop_codon:yes gene_type:complete